MAAITELVELLEETGKLSKDEVGFLRHNITARLNTYLQDNADEFFKGQ
jgi:ElaB/YqjD/DUF883 family membrane-anchored ribosome-binding protein